MRKISSNYTFLPSLPLLKYAYVTLGDVVECVDTRGIMKEISQLEFYAGLLVADYVVEYMDVFVVGETFIDKIEQIYLQNQNREFSRLALIEGADLLNFKWSQNTSVRIFS